MTIDANPNYVPSGTNNKANGHNKKDQHVKIAKNAASKSTYS